jgi:hypothetical protein
MIAQPDIKAADSTQKIMHKTTFKFARFKPSLPTLKIVDFYFSDTL